MIQAVLIQIVGWLGVSLYVAGYGLLSFNRLDSNSPGYHALNAAGGICLVIFSASLADLPNIIVNIVWVVIAGFSLTRIFKLKRNRSRSLVNSQ